jgi:hypothetical protein
LLAAFVFVGSGMRARRVRLGRSDEARASVCGLEEPRSRPDGGFVQRAPAVRAAVRGALELMAHVSTESPTRTSTFL